jgi:hypothetical protein
MIYQTPEKHKRFSDFSRAGRGAGTAPNSCRRAADTVQTKFSQKFMFFSLLFCI